MAVTKRTVASPRTVPSPSRRLVAAGIKRGPADWLVEQPKTAPLPWAALCAMTRLELALADQNVASFDNYGSLWGYDAVEKAEADVAEARADGAEVDEWETVDRDGQPLRVVRIADPTFLDTICVFSTWNPSARRSTTSAR